MSISAERELQRSIKQKQFPSAYYLHGANDFLKAEAVRNLISAAVDPSTRDFNLDQVQAAEVTAETLEALINTPPMMAAVRVTVVSDVNALRKDARQVLDRYLLHPSRDLLLLLVTSADAKEDKQLSARAVPVEFATLDQGRLLKWVQHQAATALGVSIEEDAVNLLLVGAILWLLVFVLIKVVPVIRRGRVVALDRAAVDQANPRITGAGELAGPQRRRPGVG